MYIIHVHEYVHYETYDLYTTHRFSMLYMADPH